MLTFQDMVMNKMRNNYLYPNLFMETGYLQKLLLLERAFHLHKDIFFKKASIQMLLWDCMELSVAPLTLQTGWDTIQYHLFKRKLKFKYPNYFWKRNILKDCEIFHLPAIICIFWTFTVSEHSQATSLYWIRRLVQQAQIVCSASRLYKSGRAVFLHLATSDPFTWMMSTEPEVLCGQSTSYILRCPAFQI